jgi:lipid II:glycine glycyltransferase (peptidoglycan interpeptide bridge formation enzyme)
MYAKDGGLLQSDEWAQLQAASGHTPLHFRGEGFEGNALQYTLPLFGNYLFIPRGPIVDASRIKNQESKMREELLRIAQAARAGWIRIEPQAGEALEILKTIFGEARVIAAPRDTNPREILMVSLSGDVATWLDQMKPKTRYNVRLAEKHGVTVRFSRSKEDIERFIELIYATTNRKAIAPHPKDYYQNFFATLPDTMCALALAEHAGEVIAAALLVFFEGTAYYLHGGSADTKRELMAPFLLHFKAMEEAKQRGCTRYDFGGVRMLSKRDAGDTDWDGITRFKQGFAPKAETLVFPGTYDIILSPTRYALYRQSRRLRGIRRAYRLFVHCFQYEIV